MSKRLKELALESWGRSKVDLDTPIVLGFSGGKDSVAAYILLTKVIGFRNVTGLFVDTGHESSKFCEEWSQQFDECPCLDCYLNRLETEFGFNLVRISPTMRDFMGELKPEKIVERMGKLGISMSEDDSLWEQPLDMKRLCAMKRRAPSSTVRFCTTILKLVPARRWHEKNGNLGIRAAGVRAQESKARAKRNPWKWDEFFNMDLWLPIFEFDHSEVFGLHTQYGVPENPLYRHGVSRVGCFPCVFCNKKELQVVSLRFPEAISHLEKGVLGIEKAMEAVKGDVSSFWANDKTPERWHSHTDPASGKTFPDALDVMKWALGELPSGSTQGVFDFMDFHELEDEDTYACTSQYGLCE